jgi:hypothetical protein
VAEEERLSVEVVRLGGDPAKVSSLDFSVLPVDATAAPASRGDEWDPHRVYFSEFLASESKADAKKKQDSNSPAARSKLEKATEKTKCKDPSSGAALPAAFQPFDDDEDVSVDVSAGGPAAAVAVLLDKASAVLDPLGWPRQVPLVAEPQPEEAGGGRGGGDDADDEEDLLGPSRRSDYCDDGPAAAAAEALDDRDEVRGEDAGPAVRAKSRRIERYGRVEADEASLDGNSSVEGAGDGSGEDEEPAEEDGGMEVAYRAQDDDSDDESDCDDEDEVIRSEFQDMFLHAASSGKSDDDTSDREVEQQHTPAVAFATFMPAMVSSDVEDIGAFEVNWADAESGTGVSRSDVAVASNQAGSPSPAPFALPPRPSPQDGLSERKSVPLIRPPPEEKVRKWLRGKK